MNQIEIQTMHYEPRLPWWGVFALPLEWGYCLLGWGRGVLYRIGLLQPVKVSIPVISVGNLTTGGTGKTPMVIALAKCLVKKGFKVAVLTRGYGAKGLCDEPRLIQQAVPEALVQVGANRAKLAKAVIESDKPDCILLDDGFQHWPLARDLDIVLVDGLLGFGNQHCLPLGPLREPLSALSRAGLVMLTKSINYSVLDQVESLMKQHQVLEDRRASVLSVPYVTSPLFLASGQTGDTGFSDTKLDTRAEARVTQPAVLNQTSYVVAFCGIAQPSYFFENLKTLGLGLDEIKVFPDHHAFSEQDIQALTKINSTRDTVWVCTPKDWIKLESLWPEVLKPKVYLTDIEPMLELNWLFTEYLSPVFSKMEQDIMIKSKKQIPENQSSEIVPLEIPE